MVFDGSCPRGCAASWCLGIPKVTPPPPHREGCSIRVRKTQAHAPAGNRNRTATWPGPPRAPGERCLSPRMVCPIIYARLQPDILTAEPKGTRCPRVDLGHLQRRGQASRRPRLHNLFPRRLRQDERRVPAPQGFKTPLTHGSRFHGPLSLSHGALACGYRRQHSGQQEEGGCCRQRCEQHRGGSRLEMASGIARHCTPIALLRGTSAVPHCVLHFEMLVSGLTGRPGRTRGAPGPWGGCRPGFVRGVWIAARGCAGVRGGRHPPGVRLRRWCPE